MRQERILSLLKRFQGAYDKKDVQTADAFMEDMFVKEPNISILGTSDGELCLGYEACKDIFVNDWNYWSFEHLDFDNIIMKEIEDVVLVYAKAYFSFTYSNEDSRYENYLNHVKEEMANSERIEEKLAQINWILSHMFHQRRDSPRKYLKDLRVTFVFVWQNDNYKIKQMQFSVLNDINESERILDEDDVKKSISEELKIMKERTNKEDDDIRNFLKKFNEDYFKIDPESLINKYFSNDLLFLNPDHKEARDVSTLEDILHTQKEHWETIKFYHDEAYIERVGNTILLMTYGFAEKQMTKETYQETVRKQILDTMNLSLNNKDKLFEVRKIIASGYKNQHSGFHLTHPLRLHALITKENESYKFNFLHLSYPFYFILENKNQYMHLLEETL